MGSHPQTLLDWAEEPRENGHHEQHRAHPLRAVSLSPLAGDPTHLLHPHPPRASAHSLLPPCLKQETHVDPHHRRRARGHPGRAARRALAARPSGRPRRSSSPATSPAPSTSTSTTSSPARRAGGRSPPAADRRGDCRPRPDVGHRRRQHRRGLRRPGNPLRGARLVAADVRRASPTYASSTGRCGPGRTPDRPLETGDVAPAPGTVTLSYGHLPVVDADEVLRRRGHGLAARRAGRRALPRRDRADRSRRRPHPRRAQPPTGENVAADGRFLDPASSAAASSPPASTPSGRSRSTAARASRLPTTSSP